MVTVGFFKSNSCRLTSLAKNLFVSLNPKPYSGILFASDGSNWVLDWEIRELSNIARGLGIPVRFSGELPFSLPRQAIFFSSKYILMNPKRYLSGSARIAFPYFHGDPRSGNKVFIECMNNLKKYHSRISCVQVSHAQGREMVLETGIDPSKVFLIPIGINRDYFPRQTPESRHAMREKYDVPHDAVVVGSFQKDGEGWGEGNDPKMIKGPDIFLKTVEILGAKVKNLCVLLSGPSRGYVKQGLERLKIPYRHHYLDDYPRIGELFQCLDLYIIASREEGGPKAVLESMCADVPLITTRVGQAVDLVRHRENGWMVDVEDAEGLAFWAEAALTDREGLRKVLDEGQRTAEKETYGAQAERWRQFFSRLVDV